MSSIAWGLKHAPGVAVELNRRQRRLRRVSVAVVAALVVGLFYAATASSGEKVHEARLNDSGVWVTSAALAKFGRLNTPIEQLDAGVSTDVPEGSGLDVLQDGSAVLGLAKGTGQLLPIDPKVSSAGSGSQAPAFPVTEAGTFKPLPIDLRAGTVATVDPKTGKVWAQRFDPQAPLGDLGELAPTTKPLATVGANPAIAVDDKGNVHVVSGRTGQVVTLAARADGFAKPVTVKTALRSENPDITTLGTTWVAFDATKDRIFTAEQLDGVEAHATAKDSPGAALQQPGPTADAVAISSVVGTTMVRLDGGTPSGGVIIDDQVNRDVKGTFIARPVVLKGCLHAAWAQQGKVFYGANCGRDGQVPTGTIDNANEVPTREGVAFRVNRDQIVLNDLDNGSLWDLDDKPKKLDNWDSLIPPPQRQDDTQKKDENLVDDVQLSQPPKAVDDQFTVRPGRTSKLHVLDNDTDVAGSVLGVDPGDVSPPDVQDITAVASADGQTIDVTVPVRPDATEFTFTYKVNNGKSKERPQGKVTVRVVGDETNTAPKLREGAKELASTVYPVVAGERLSVPVLADWRDAENDSISPLATDATSMIDGRGQVTALAPVEPGPRSIAYAVSDGRGGQSEGQFSINVLDPSDTQMVPPKSQPDVVRGIVGKPVQIEPLGNDIAGADTADPDAGLVLQSPVRAVGPMQVDTELTTGVVTITGTGAGSFELAYAARTGGGIAPGRIRVDLVAEPGEAPPVAVPDSGTLHDQAPVLIDVLANDYSPRGDVLVTSAVSVDSANSWLRPSIFQGRWVRVEATQPAPLTDTSGRPGTISYTISDGTKRTTGQIAVIQRPALQGVVPIVVDDVATVRQGDTVSIPVLDNDSMADGIPLKVEPSSVKVISAGDAPRAFASGNVIRYVPEATGLTAPRVVTIEYAAYPEGQDAASAQTGRATVTVNPLPTETIPNQPPAARSFSASVTSGDPLTITIPTFGVDPDGDSVTVAGIVGSESGPVELKFGRVMSFGPSTIRYEAYPLASGTEILNYEVVDRFGEKSRAFIRIGVVPPGDPEPPVAVQDTVMAAPGKKVTVKILRNDLIARGDSISLEVKELNAPEKLAQWSVDTEDNTVQTVVPAPDEPIRELTYGIDNGLFDPSRTSVLVHAIPGFQNPPVARDDVATPESGKATAVVDVLANDDDIDGADLTIAEVLSEHARVVDGKVEVDILDHTYTVPYVIEDEDGLPAMAVIYVPTGDKGIPFVVQSALITMDKDSTKQVALADHVKSPRSRVVGIVAADTVSASPGDKLEAVANGTKDLTLTSSGGYVGPAAVMVEVTDQESLDQQDFGTAIVSIPVQIGPKVPLMRCPEADISVSAGGRSRHIDIPTLCRAWLPPGMTLDDLTFQSAWTVQPDGTELEVEGKGGRQVAVSAGESAPSGTGTISVTTAGMEQLAEIGVRVFGKPKASGEAGSGDPTDPANVPPPTLRPMTVTGLQQGRSQTLDVSAYLDSPLAAPQCAITAARVEAGQGLEISHSGCALTLTATTQPSPTASIGITVTDRDPSRVADGRVSVTMLGAPGAPTGVQAQPDRLAGRQATVSWVPPTYNGGLPIQGYKVAWAGSSQQCTSSPCLITGLENNKDYTFTVVAFNAVGDSPPSAASNVVRPDVKPQAPTNIHMVSRGDGTITVGWTAAISDGSPVKTYTARTTDSNGVAAQVVVPGSTTQAVFGGLNNMATQTVSVIATNDVGPGPAGNATAPMQSAGTPPNVAALNVSPRGPSAAADSELLTISWPAVSPNGPGPVTYKLYRNGVALKDVGQATSTTDTVAYDGTSYAYAVSATNTAGNESPGRNATTYTANGIPSDPTVRATPIPDNRPDWMEFVVNVGQPRAAGFQAIRWSTSSGKSGTFSCGCAAGSQVTVSVPNPNYSAQTVTVTTVNAAGHASRPATSNQVNPYGPTVAPTQPQAQRIDGGQGLRFTWTNRENGANVTGTRVRQGNGTMLHNGGAISSYDFMNLGWDTTRNIEVQSLTRAGWGPWSAMGSGTTAPPPAPKITNVRRGPWSTGGIGSCTDGCYRIKYDVSNFQDGNYSVTCRWSNDYNVGTANINNNNVNDNSAWCGVEGSEGLPTIILNGPSGRVTS